MMRSSNSNPAALRIRLIPLACSVLAATLLPFPASADENTRFRFRADALIEYTDNLFHYSDAQLTTFDSSTDAGPGERFAGIEDTSDIVTRVRFRGSVRRSGARSGFELSFEAMNFFHLENGTADYPVFTLGARIDATKSDHPYLRIRHAADQFRKNYKVADAVTFVAAEQDQTDYAVGYLRDIGKRSSVGGEFRLRRRRLNEVFDGREFDGRFLAFLGSYRVSKKIDGRSKAEYGETDSNTVLDGGVLIDRSYNQLRVAQELSFNLPARTELKVGVDYRRRNYNTPIEADGGRFDRTDHRWRLRLTADRKLGKRFTLTARASVADTDSDRVDPAIETDAAGYDETTLAIGLRYKR